MGGRHPGPLIFLRLLLLPERSAVATLSCEVLLSQPVPPTRGAHFGARSTDPAGLSVAELRHPAPQLRAAPVHLHPRLPHDRTFVVPRNPQA